MSEDGTGVSGAPESGGLYDNAGNRISASAQKELEPLVRFARDQPIATAIIAIGIGFLIAKIL
jgi:hypothetical protein